MCGIVLFAFEGELGGEREAIEQDTGFSLVDAGLGECIDHMDDGELDSGSVFEGAKFQPAMSFLGGVDGFVELLVEVAVRHAAKRHGMAAASSGLDVTALFDHGTLPWRGVYPPVCE